MTRSTNMKRKRRARVAKGVPCDGPLSPELRAWAKECRARRIPIEIDRARDKVVSWQHIEGLGPGLSLVLTGVTYDA